MTKISDIEGIGATYAQKLSEIGIKTTEALLKQGATKKGRKEIAEKSLTTPEYEISVVEVLLLLCPI